MDKNKYAEEVAKWGSQWDEYFSKPRYGEININRPPIVTVADQQLEKQRQLFKDAGEELKRIDNDFKNCNIIYVKEDCHCGKDGHPLNSMNCLVHGYEIRKKVKMTREEAIKCLGQVMNFNRYEFIACLEALGLIKFEEDETPAAIINEKLTEIRYAYNNQLPLNIDGDKIINYLANHGYKIVKD